MVKVRYNNPSVMIFGRVKIMPGINHIDDDVFKEIASHPQFKSKLDAGIFSVLGDVKIDFEETKNITSKVEKSVKSRRGRRSIDDIIAEINDTYDLKLLKQWLSAKNKDVVAAAKKRMEIVGPSEPLAKTGSK